MFQSAFGPMVRGILCNTGKHEQKCSRGGRPSWCQPVPDWVCPDEPASGELLGDTTLEEGGVLQLGCRLALHIYRKQ